MVHVRNLTSIPMPRIKDAHLNGVDDETSWILMKWVPGKQLDEAWPTLDESARARTINELKSYLEHNKALFASGAGHGGLTS